MCQAKASRVNYRVVKDWPFHSDVFNLRCWHYVTTVVPHNSSDSRALSSIPPSEQGP